LFPWLLRDESANTMADENLKVWEGVYATYDEAQAAASGKGFSSDAWIERSRRRLDEVAASPDERLLATQAYLLPVVAAMLDPRDGPLRILDFGGGTGTGFHSMSALRGTRAGIEYHLVDNPRLVALGRERYGGDPRLAFHESLPEPFPVEIVHLGSCVQYIADLDGLLDSLAAFKPEVMLFSDVFAGDIDTFWTIQNLWGSRVPFCFMRESEFVETVQGHGYTLRLRVPYILTILGKTDALPMNNFPANRRLARGGHYLFRGS